MSMKCCCLSFLKGGLLGLLLLLPSLPQAELVIRESYVKAVLLFNFTRYTQWPESVFQAIGSPYRICVLGQDTFENALTELDAAVEGETIREREIEILRIESIEQTQSCQVLFIAELKNYTLQEVFAYIRDYPILSVGNGEDFILEGGMIAYYQQGTKVRFAVNPQAVNEAKLKISANLLQLARIINRQ
ncbi:YfiR family protein [Candidatus Venteria ishoeyi]|uniref:DUF4154 domain-containing protein n=1 Tax=Candidatus Venteria ishoeyi TaxID=1899563 RepID=A0A1H6FB27_9GAMM|nr:YfiR family protein [Candidatus Venteria ishoeyi]MDM8545401.1 YfiR family protein [Candidatus Venteria ishoeyi]SEH07292.1 Uncharacterised protein [Candidatus Venteria ishoeyi]